MRIWFVVFRVWIHTQTRIWTFLTPIWTYSFSSKVPREIKSQKGNWISFLWNLITGCGSFVGLGAMGWTDCQGINMQQSDNGVIVDNYGIVSLLHQAYDSGGLCAPPLPFILWCGCLLLVHPPFFSQPFGLQVPKVFSILVSLTKPSGVFPHTLCMGHNYWACIWFRETNFLTKVW
jgi:hypothetical protein